MKRNDNLLGFVISSLSSLNWFYNNKFPEFNGSYYELPIFDSI